MASVNTKLSRKHAESIVGQIDTGVDFNLYPGFRAECGSPAYFRVSIVSDRAAQNRRQLPIVTSRIGPYPKVGVTAFTDGYQTRTGHVGDVVISRDHCGDSTVVHEMLHVLAWCLEHLSANPVSHCMAWQHEIHEQTAEILGDLVWKFWRGYTKAGLKRIHCQGFERTGK